MIEETIISSCRLCDSDDIMRNGHKMSESTVQVQSVWNLPRVDTKSTVHTRSKMTVLEAYCERMSLQRVFGLWCSTVLCWLKQLVDFLPRLDDLLPA